MNIEEFYDQDPRRRASDEVEFGREWTEHHARFEVAWIAETGEVYAMAEPLHSLSTQSMTVEVLGVVEGRDSIDAALDGWEDAMTEPDSLAWVRTRLAEAVRS
jgi:hypothetical protein